MTVSVSTGLTTLPSVAVICDEPAATPVANPLFTPIAATATLEEAHVTLAVMSFVLPSL